MNLQSYYMEATSSFHLGEIGLDVEQAGEYAAADRLFSALCTTTALVLGSDQLVSLLERFLNDNPPFLLTGAYPFVRAQDDSHIRFFPAPLTLRHVPDKSQRKVRWLSESVFRSALDGNLRNGSLPDPVSDKWLSHDELKRLGGEAYVRREAGSLFWSRNVRVPRVTVDRLSNASAIFHAGRLVFAPGGGLWCGFAILDDTWGTDFLETLLHVMGDDGFGGERSNGHGRYNLSVDHAPLNLPDPEDYFVTLAHYCPRLDGEPATLLDENAIYDVTLRRGYMYSTEAGRQLPRQMIRMLTPGSVLRSLPNHATYGRLVDVTPIDATTHTPMIHHSVYRYGYALPVGIRVERGA